MDRRKFLRALAVGAASLLLHDEKAAAYILETWEPPIRKLFLQFTEYEERPTTEMIVIHHAGFPTATKILPPKRFTSFIRRSTAGRASAIIT